MEQEEVTRTRWKNTLSDYGPTILGIVIVILIIVVGWSFFQSRAKKATVPMPSSIAQVTPSPIATTADQPSARLNLGSAEPLPAQAGATPQPSASASASTTKGGVSKLPETGFPLLPLAIASLGMIATGFYLRRK
ncbi:hypothetical protein HYZ78_01205 [Candidatus Microgenomates bacterium]|nr:hypothetical protein [Candidatus Microgenomates bacterium]